MPHIAYDWLRFWCPPEGTYSLSDGGFLSDPDSEWGSALNPDAKKFEEIAAKPCLVLLGEPGIGKSHELGLAKQAMVTDVGELGDEVLILDLREFQTDVRLCARLFESQEFRRWDAGSHRLHLLLDSLDECLIQIKTVAALLEKELGRYQVDRLTLRIACRTADWPHSLEQALKGLWGDANVGVYELLPLRRRDVRAAAEAQGIDDPDRFIEEVGTREAVPLAIKPVTLRMLINLYRKGATLPTRQADLYEQGCRRLCKEPNLARRESGAVSDVPSPVQFAAAGRIAAATVFANRFAVWKDIDEGAVPPEDVTVRQLSGGAEAVDGGRTEVTEHVIRETLKTGLFTSRGPHRLGWAHQTYAEFLAARYVVASGMTHEQVMSLVVHPDDPGQKLVPQLHETAAWIAGMRPEVFQAIMDRDPEVLLKSDVAAAEPEDRKRLVDALLALYAEGKFTPGSLDLRGHYHKLAHPRLADQLRPYVLDKNAHWLVRRVAIDISEACKVKSLVPELVRIALDQPEETQVRKKAAYAVIRAGDAAAKAQLKPLALGQAGADPDDDLKGCGLQAVWPDHMTAQELFQALTARKRTNYAGSYVAFRLALRKELPEQLQMGDLQFAMNWVAKGHAKDHDVEELGELIIITGWQALEEHPELAQPFARAALARLRDYEAIAKGSEDRPFGQEVRQDAARRRAVLVAVMEAVGPKEETFWLVHTQTPLATDEDVVWLAERVLEAPPDRKDAWLSLINWVFNPHKPGHLDTVIGLCKREPSLGKAFSWLNAVEIESPEGRKMKADYLRHKRLERQMEAQRNRPLLTPPPKERVLALLDEFERGDRNGWWRLNMEMTLEPNSTRYGDELEWDLTTLPGWRDADEATRARIIDAARRYVASPPPMDQSWLGTNTLHRPACAGYRALALLHATDPAFLDGLPTEAWAVWAPIVIAFPLHNSGLWEKSPHTDLVRLAYEHAPDAILAALNTFWWDSSRLDHCCDDRIGEVLLQKAKAPDIQPDHLENLLYQLLKHQYPPALEHALSRVSVPLPTDTQERARTMVAAHALLAHCPGAAWPTVWASIETDTTFGRDLLEGLRQSLDREVLAQFRQELSEQEIGNLYLWLAAQYPHKEDPHHDGAHFVGPRENVAWFRDGLLELLKNRGTPAACEQVRRIARELPEVPWLKWAVQEAEEQTRRQTWQPPRPEHVIALAQDRQRRYVENGEQLLDALCESLQRLEAILQGETPAAPDLWNNRGDVTRPEWRPKGENHLSDYVKRHLERDLRDHGVVVNREVQIRRGQKTDIRVDAVSPGGEAEAPRVISGIIEVKGCWNNRELDSAMETQLVGRYLKDNQCPNGLYILGWFNCDLWSDNDYWKKDAPTYGLEEARKRFAQQAQELQDGGAVPGLTLKAFVLNACLTDTSARRRNGRT